MSLILFMLGLYCCAFWSQHPLQICIAQGIPNHTAKIYPYSIKLDLCVAVVKKLSQVPLQKLQLLQPWFLHHKGYHLFASSRMLVVLTCAKLSISSVLLRSTRKVLKAELNSICVPQTENSSIHVSILYFFEKLPQHF